MALIRTFMIGVTLVCGMLTGAAWGQNHTPGTFFERTPDGAENLPLATPGMFDYDAQLFAPLEFTNGKEKEPNTGLYAEFSKTYISLERAGRFDSGLNQQTSNGTEWYPGTRYELGWYGQEDRGWNASFAKTEGTFFFNNRQGIFNSPPSEGNLRLTTVELNRSYRQETSKGGVLEPFFGFRYNWMRDRLFDGTNVTAGTSQFTQNASNTAFGFQVGSRFSKRRGRWRFTSRGNAAATYNQQRLDLADALDGDTNVTFVDTTFTDQTFLPIIDGTLEATYNFTRDLSLKFGVQGSYIWSGVLRANTEPTPINGLSTNSDAGSPLVILDDENYVAAGFILGIEFRR